MRLFVGLQPEPRTCLDIAHWIETSLPPLEHPVPAVNYHITLAFLGNVDRLEALEQLLASVHHPPVEIVLNELGYWSRPGILWLGTDRQADSIHELARKIRKISNRLRLPVRRKPFHPHLTIARRCATLPPCGVNPPDFSLHFTRFSLFESTVTNSGVHYQSLHTWPLTTP